MTHVKPTRALFGVFTCCAQGGIAVRRRSFTLKCNECNIHTVGEVSVKYKQQNKLTSETLV